MSSTSRVEVRAELELRAIYVNDSGDESELDADTFTTSDLLDPHESAELAERTRAWLLDVLPEHQRAELEGIPEWQNASDEESAEDAGSGGPAASSEV